MEPRDTVRNPPLSAVAEQGGVGLDSADSFLVKVRNLLLEKALCRGNIEGRTRVLTTAIVLETRKGNFDLAVTLGVILIALSFLVNVAMLYLQGRMFEE